MSELAHVLVWSASYGGGHARAASALVTQLSARYGDKIRVTSTDLFERHMPRLRALAAVAYRNSAEFFPDSDETLLELVRRAGDDPCVREMSSGGLAGVEAAMDAFQPRVVVSFHPLAGGMTSELRERTGCATVTVICDQAPGRWWLHPGTDLYCVANADVRHALASRGIPWDRIAVTGVPVPAPVRPASDLAAARRLAGLAERQSVFVFPSSERGATSGVIESLVASGRQVVVADGATASDASGSVRSLPYDEAIALLPAADVAVCSGGGSALWSAPAAGVPLVVAGPVAAQERVNVDHAVNAGAALEARDARDAIARVEYLLGHGDRSRRMAHEAAATARPSSSAAVAERVAALLR